ncbi:MAG TPA: metallopeptidase [Lachnospiraceae bacterium]|nr:metallopeptidase [Lachnospiraceae bacterium]
MHATERLREISEKILEQTRTDLYLSLHFLGESLDSLPWQMDLSTTSIGTDAEFMRYNPRFLMQTFLQEPKWMARTYLHIILHCLLLHPMAEIPRVADQDRLLWNLACDIAVESIIDSLEDCPAVSRVLPDFRAEWYERLGAEMKVLTAEKIYRYFMENPPDPVSEEKLVIEFTLCDHGFWEELTEKEKKNSGEDKETPSQDPEGKQREDLEKSWQNRSERMMAELENSGTHLGQMTGTLTRILAVQNRKRMSYRDFLKRYAYVREEARVDPDSFDYGFYNYGMELYGNMPLMEENEYRESKKVEELVIVIDTSASTQANLVQHFLNETASILRSRETFFHRIELRILECDNQVQKDILIRSPEEMQKYLETFEVSGGFGTDFRPAFEYVEKLRTEGHLKNLRGLLYFTDGAGIYPSRPTKYETVFVFRSDENFFEKHVPDWCVKVYLGEGDRIEYQGKR